MESHENGTASRPAPPPPHVETVEEHEKETVKEQAKEQVKEEVKEQPKEQVKEEAKEEKKEPEKVDIVEDSKAKEAEKDAQEQAAKEEQAHQEALAKEAAKNAQVEKEKEEKAQQEKEAKRVRDEMLKDLLRDANDAIERKIAEQSTQTAPATQEKAAEPIATPAPAALVEEKKVDEGKPAEPAPAAPATATTVPQIVEPEKPAVTPTAIEEPKKEEPKMEEAKPAPSYDLNMTAQQLHKELIPAIKAGEVDTVKTLIGHPNIGPSTLKLSLCFLSIHSPLVLVLDLKLKNSEAMKVASEQGHTAIVSMLLTDGRCDPSANSNIAIVMASWNGHHETVVRLLEDLRVDPASKLNYSIRGTFALL